jgi:prenyltransferase beta subunit
MLQVARLSPKVLGESAELVAAFLTNQQNPDGGFRDRAGATDLYYTVFGLDGLIALHRDPPATSTRRFLESLDGGADLDFVHLACLARAWATISRNEPVSSGSKEILNRIEQFRSTDGGYNPVPRAIHGTAYGAFLALGAYQDLRVELPSPERLLHSIGGLQSRDGAYGNQPGMSEGQTSATAAAIAVRRQLGDRIDERLGDWLLARVHPQGGFVAAPAIPMPDLLSTATALHALATLQRRIDAVRDLCLDFVDTLWTSRGGFYGSWADDHLDCEYTYYGLLSLGHLSV